MMYCVPFCTAHRSGIYALMENCFFSSFSSATAVNLKKERNAEKLILACSLEESCEKTHGAAPDCKEIEKCVNII